MKKRKQRSNFIRADKLEQLVVGNELVIRRVSELQSIGNWKIQVHVRTLDPLQGSLSYSVEGNNIRDALNEAYRQYVEDGSNIRR